MAKLHKDSYPGNWDFNPAEPVNDYFARIDKMLAAIPDEKVIYFPVADGNAIYYIKSEKPLVLQHIPYGDAWHADPILIRGLRLSDVKAMVASNLAVAKMFAGKK